MSDFSVDVKDALARQRELTKLECSSARGAACDDRPGDLGVADYCIAVGMPITGHPPHRTGRNVPWAGPRARVDRPFCFSERVVPSFDPQPVFFVPVLDRQFGIAIEAVIVGANLRFGPARFVAQQQMNARRRLR